MFVSLDSGLQRLPLGSLGSACTRAHDRNTLFRQSFGKEASYASVFHVTNQACYNLDSHDAVRPCARLRRKGNDFGKVVSSFSPFPVHAAVHPFGRFSLWFWCHSVLQGNPISWMALQWSPKDLRLFHASVGDPAWPAEWELYAILLAVDTWLAQLRGEAACLFQADATAALFSAARMPGRTPAMNAVAAEIALRLESAHVHIAAEHYRGVLNFHCDALSRLSQGAEIPAALASVERCSPKPLSPRFFWA